MDNQDRLQVGCTKESVYQDLVSTLTNPNLEIRQRLVLMLTPMCRGISYSSPKMLWLMHCTTLPSKSHHCKTTSLHSTSGLECAQ